MTWFHKTRDSGKIVPLEVATTYIFNNHDHREEDGVAVVESVELEKFLLAESRPAPRDWDAEGMPEAEILRRWKIVDAMIEEYEDAVLDEEEAEKQIKTAVENENWYAVKYFNQRRENRGKIASSLKAYLSEGDE